MAKLKGLTLSKSEVSQTINLEELLGVDFTGNRALRLAIAQAVIDHIVERTEDGKSRTGRGFTPYSKEYKESGEFAILKGSSSVNMKLTGNMLASLDVLSDGKNTIRIGWDDDEEILKAYNHNVGDTVPRREFFGVTASEAKDVIMNAFGEEIRSMRSEGRLSVSDVLRESVRAVDAAQNISPLTVVRILNGGDIVG